MNSSIRPVIYGEVLFDLFPGGEKVLGGAPFNVAWHLNALQANPHMFTSVGNDDLGTEIISAIKKWDMDTAGVAVNPTRPTGVVKVIIENDEPSYDIVDNSAWDNISLSAEQLGSGDLLYHGSLALRHSDAYLQILSLAESCNRFIDINLRPPWYSIDLIKPMIKQAEWLKLNEHELQEIVPGDAYIENKLNYLHNDLGVSNIIITQGAAGASFSRGNGIEFNIKPEPVSSVVDTVGAGDAFSSIMMLGIIKNWDVETSFSRAQTFASAIVQQRGATVVDKKFYDQFIQAWFS